jgi:tRNA-2-methylthio-N6-dimethylallyladenosine synthase
VLEEARALVAQGVREITLLGQNVNAYHGAGPDGADWSLARLLEELSAIEGLARLRYTTSHPNDMGEDLIAAHGALDKLMPYLHLPVQAGSDRILKAMNRSHTAESYLRLIERIRAAQPDILISGDFIVGFPGETEADFRDTLALVEEVGYGQCYSFKYSPRPGTPAAERALVDPAEADDRLQRLQALLTRQQQAFQASMVGRETEILVERAGRLPGQMTGKTPWLHAAHVTRPGVAVGDLVPVRIVESLPNSLAAEALGAP